MNMQAKLLEVPAAERTAAGVRRIKVRLLNSEADIEKTWPLFESFVMESRYRNIEMDRDARASYMRRHFLERADTHGFIIAEIGDEAAGFLSCVITRLLYSKYTISSALAFYVMPQVRAGMLGGRVAIKLLHAYRNWAKARGVLEIQMHVTHGFDLPQADKFFRKTGFKCVGGNYSMQISGRGGIT